MITEDVFDLGVMVIRRRLLSHCLLHHIGAEPRHLRNTLERSYPSPPSSYLRYILRQKGVSLPNEKNIQHHWSV